MSRRAHAAERRWVNPSAGTATSAGIAERSRVGKAQHEFAGGFGERKGIEALTGQEAIDRLLPGDHVCWVFDDDQICARSMARYVGAGLRAGQKVLYYTHTWRPAALLAGWESLGVPVREAANSTQLVLRTAADTYLAGGSFDAQATADGWLGEARLAKQEGYTGLRVAGDMAWAAASQIPGTENLPAYEAQINGQVFAHGEVMGVCLYDRRRFTAAELSKISAVHPATLLDRPGGGRGSHVRMRYTDDPAGLRLSGTADVSNRDAIAAVLTQLPQRTRRTRLVVDVSDLSFADAATAVMLADATTRSGARVTLRGHSPAMQRLLTLVTGGAWDSAESET